MSDPPSPPPALEAPRAPARLQTWRWSGTAWRVSRLMTRRRIDLLLRARGGRILPPAARARFLAMGLPEDIVAATLAEVRSLDGWADAWTKTAQRYLGEARRGGPGADPEVAALARRQAALCYHVAQLLVTADPRTARAHRATATTLFGQAAPLLTPPLRRVLLPWRATTLPAYLAFAGDDERAAPLVVLLNGTTTAKEETILWSHRFHRRGFATLAIDWPGTGEATDVVSGGAADLDDVTDGVFALAEGDARLDGARVALVGISLGGALAVRAAAYDRRVAACVAVTPPYAADGWLGAANAVVLDQLAAMVGGAGAVPDLARGFALPPVMLRLRCPLLVMGAGRDLVIPPAEAPRLCHAAGDLGTLVWYPHAGHALYDVLPEWTADAARWLAAATDDGAPLSWAGPDKDSTQSRPPGTEDVEPDDA